MNPVSGAEMIQHLRGAPAAEREALALLCWVQSNPGSASTRRLVRAIAAAVVDPDGPDAALAAEAWDRAVNLLSADPFSRASDEMVATAIETVEGR